jgi:hypothetical protein
VEDDSGGRGGHPQAAGPQSLHHRQLRQLRILPELVDEYTDMVKHLVDRYYTGVTRYTTSTFLRMKLGDALQKRDVAPHIYESGAEARRALKTDRRVAVRYRTFSFFVKQGAMDAQAWRHRGTP